MGRPIDGGFYARDPLRTTPLPRRTPLGRRSAASCAAALPVQYGLDSGGLLVEARMLVVDEHHLGRGVLLLALSAGGDPAGDARPQRSARRANASSPSTCVNGRRVIDTSAVPTPRCCGYNGPRSGNASTMPEGRSRQCSPHPRPAAACLSSVATAIRLLKAFSAGRGRDRIAAALARRIGLAKSTVHRWRHPVVGGPARAEPRDRQVFRSASACPPGANGAPAA